MLGEPREKVLHGIPASEGVCRGRIHVLGRSLEDVPFRRIHPAEIPHEVERIQHALLQTRREINNVQRQVQDAMGGENATIFEAHLLVLEDQMLLDEVMRLIREDHANAEYALQQASRKYVATLQAVDDEFLRERTSDMRDATDRLLRNLLGNSAEHPNQLTTPSILISHDLAPSTTALLDKSKVLGFATDTGSKTSHTAILARSLHIPAVVGLKDASEVLKNGEDALLDGFNGTLIVNPGDQTLFEYGQLVRKHTSLQKKLAEYRHIPTVTRDGHHRVVAANIERAAAAEEVLECGADGVGLFRTEYLFIQRDSLPSEEDQYLAYRHVAETLHPRPVVIRSLDLGGDKLLTHLEIPTEINPFLGWRAIRFCLHRQDIFRSQLRAILRASAHGNVRLMYPMITCGGELMEANAILEECRAELRRDGSPFDENLPVGAMIETPSAAVSADVLAPHVRFFSIGTNDLIQYTLAVDRLNEKIAHLYQPTNPSIVRLIKRTVEAAAAEGIPVSICGEMAGDPVLVPLLIGLGIQELSAAPALVPQVRYLIRNLEIPSTQELAEFALHCGSGDEILRRCQAMAHAAGSSLFDHQTGN